MKTSSSILILCMITLLHVQTAVSLDGLEKIADGFEFVEGPVWKDGAILFSDIPANTVYRWTPENGAEVYIQPSGNSNGLALDLDGNLLLAQHGKRQIARIDTTGAETALVTHYDGKRLNSPNDMTVKSDGAIFFTDPPYGLDGAPGELGYYGIYRISPGGKVRLLDKSLSRPNGIAFSPDEQLLYVSDTEVRRIYVWDVVNDSLIENKRLFANIQGWGSADGMKIDREGRLFATGPLGVHVYGPDGTVIDTIQVPGQTTNCNWGDEDGNTLYITSGSALYRVRNTLLTGISPETRGNHTPQSFRLDNIYPNPFNGTARITFHTALAGRIKINILNVRGEKVTEISNQHYPAGEHNIAWNAETQSSGVYFIQLLSEYGADLKKCTYIK